MADIVFDVDGTLMNVDHRRHFVEGNPKDWVAFREHMIRDKPNEDVCAVARALDEVGHRIIIASGRLEEDLELTKTQLRKAGVRYCGIFLRKNEDKYRSDSEVKEEFLVAMRNDYYEFNPTMVFDDRQKVVDMWRKHGLRVFQVAKGDF
tara:strand:- start:376 stop:822 length:447 start_codon:yes stop_codon:yes gene_type:complete